MATTWKKYFKLANQDGVMSPISGQTSRPGHSNSSDSFGFRNYASTLPEVYVGHPNRIERYNQYEAMDADSEINACLDIIAEFSTQWNEKNNTPFEIRFKDTPTDSEVEIIKKQLQQWVKLNKFDQRLFKLFRNTIKYGDQVFVRDPETFQLMWVDMTKVSRVIVNESAGKEPEQYVIRDLNPNFKNLTVAAKSTTDMAVNPVGGASPAQGYTVPGTTAGGAGMGRFASAVNESVIEAEHIRHLSLSEGLDVHWPFGTSILENIFKVFKQKELLEDAILIYRVQRAPERRVFYIDVGNMMPHMAMAFVERVKNEIHQRRIPTMNGGGSSMLDAAYNPLCLDMTTEVPLLDGRTLTIAELANEFEAGKENWVFSCDPVTGRIVPGNITWAGITRKNAQVLKITLNNGKTITATPDHKFPVLGKGFVEAQHLTPEDSLISYETRYKSLSKDKTRDYQQVYDHEKNKWVFVHRMVAEFFKNIGKHQEFTFCEDFAAAAKTVVHHVNYDRYNNDPRNLTWMSFNDHVLYHSHVKKEYWEKLSTGEADRIRNKIRESLAATRAAYTEQDKQRIAEICSKAQKTRWANIDRNSPKLLAAIEKQKATFAARFEADPEFAEKKRNIARSNRTEKNVWQNVRFRWTQDMLQSFVELVAADDLDRLGAISAANQNEKFLNLLKEANPAEQTGKFGITYEFTNSKLESMYRTFGYRNWKDFKKKIPVYNHRITSIEWLAEPMDTGCITIDGNERWHKYHTFATKAGVFVKNSIHEDYFFPQTAEGRGSKVETLPGGDNLGQIDDLKYFNNKLCRGLRVPSSYLPTGPDDQTTPLSDGRVGTALIQEYRFNQYCQRLQSLIIQSLDDEFKMFLNWRGFNIDSGIFDITFTPPQNFASYRQTELDATRVNVFQSLEQVPYLSKRFMLERFLGLSKEEMLENEKLWAEEREEAEGVSAQGEDMRSVGVMPGGMTADMEMGDEFGEPENLEPGDMELPPGGAELGAPSAPGAAPAGATPPPPPPAG